VPKMTLKGVLHIKDKCNHKNILEKLNLTRWARSKEESSTTKINK
jgi:hypothetical protein